PPAQAGANRGVLKMAYYSNSGSQIHSGAAGLLQSYKDGSLGVMATLTDGSNKVSSGLLTKSIYSLYNMNSFGSKVPVKKLPPDTQMWKIALRVDKGKQEYLYKINDAIRAQGGALIEYKKGTGKAYYGSMYYPENLYHPSNQYNKQWVAGIPLVIIS